MFPKFGKMKIYLVNFVALEFWAKLELFEMSKTMEIENIRKFCNIIVHHSDFDF